MHLKDFEAGRYEDNQIIIRNPANNSMELFTESQFEFVKFLKHNEKETLLALLLPNIGIAKKEHILVCLKVLTKLKKMQIVDYFSIIGKFTQSNTGTLELSQKKKKLEFSGAKSLADLFFVLSEKTLSFLGCNFLLILTFLLAVVSFIFFPFETNVASLSAAQFDYLKFYTLAYLVPCVAFSFRAFLQSAFLKASGREMKEREFGLYFPFFGLKGNAKDIWMTGYQSRLQMDVLGLFSPLALSFVFTALTRMSLIDPFYGFVGFSACIAVTLILACPIFSFDMADILHVIFYRDQLPESISQRMKKIFKTSGSLSKALLGSLLFTLAWLFIWLNTIKDFWELISSQVVNDILNTKAPREMFFASVAIFMILSLILTPVLIFIVNIFRERLNARSKRLIVISEEARSSLTFEERMTALEKIPLFTILNDADRLALLNQMSVAYYEDGKYLVHQGEVGKEFLVLVKGHANALYADARGKTIKLASLQDGDAFGEIALIDDVPRTASIVSDGGCITLVLKKEGFDRFIAGLGTPDRVKTMIRLTSFFRRHPLFSKLNAKDQAQLIDSFEFHTLMAGEEVVGAESDENFYVIYSGKVRVDTGDDVSETFLESDDCFGYTPSMKAKYFATEGTGLLSVPINLFHKLIWEKLVEKPELFL